jgi:hypothetical protein
MFGLKKCESNELDRAYPNLEMKGIFADENMFYLTIK